MNDQIKTDFEKIVKNSAFSEKDVELKKKYLNKFIETGFPSRKLENWKFLDLSQIIKKDIGELSFYNDYSETNKIDTYDASSVTVETGAGSQSVTVYASRDPFGDADGYLIDAGGVLYDLPGGVIVASSNSLQAVIDGTRRDLTLDDLTVSSADLSDKSMLLAEFDSDGSFSFHPLDASEMAGLSKYSGLDVDTIPTTRGDSLPADVQVGFGTETNPIESVSDTSFASNYDSSEAYTPYTDANADGSDVISSDTDTFWKGTFAGEVLDLSDYTDKTTGADYSFSSDHIEIGTNGDYFTVTDQSKPAPTVHQPTTADMQDATGTPLVYTDNRWHTEKLLSPDATDPSKVDNAYDDVQVYFQYQDDDSKRYAIDTDTDGVPDMDINYSPDKITVDHPGQMNSDNVFTSLWKDYGPGVYLLS